MLTRLLNTIGLFTRAQYEHQLDLNREADEINENHIRRETELTTERDKADILAMRYKSRCREEEEKRFEIEKERLSLIDTNKKLNDHISVLDKSLQESVRSHNTSALRVNTLEKEVEALNATIDENSIRISDLTHAREEYIKTINELNSKIAKQDVKVKVKVDKSEVDKAVKDISDKLDAIGKAVGSMKRKTNTKPKAGKAENKE